MGKKTQPDLSTHLLTSRHEINTKNMRPILVLEVDKEGMTDVAALHGMEVAKEALLTGIKDLLDREFE